MRYVNDFLIFYSSNHSDTKPAAAIIYGVFHNEISSFELTTENASDNRLRFLDLELLFSENLVCWGYAPRLRKGLFPFSCAHSKIVKHGIAKACMKVALVRCYYHQAS